MWPLRIWRHVHVLSSATLTEVHRVIQTVMGWEALLHCGDPGHARASGGFGQMAWVSSMNAAAS